MPSRGGGEDKEAYRLSVSVQPYDKVRQVIEEWIDRWYDTGYGKIHEMESRHGTRRMGIAGATVTCAIGKDRSNVIG